MRWVVSVAGSCSDISEKCGLSNISLLSHFHKTVNLSYVNDSTVGISVPVKVLGFTKQIGINLSVKRIEGTDLFLAYDGKLGIDLLVAPALAFVKRLAPEKTDFVQSLSGNVIKISLGDIDKLEKVFDKLVLKNITFDSNDIVVEATML